MSAIVLRQDMRVGLVRGEFELLYPTDRQRMDR